MQVVVITGATGALGSATASILGGAGASILLMARASPRLDALRDSLRSEGVEVDVVPVDLSSLSSVREAAATVADGADRVDALVHTAAVFNRKRTVSEEGFEVMLATNHLGPFLLTNLLRDRLLPESRVITVTAPSTTPVDLDQLTSPDGFKPLRVFGATKAANLLFTFELARRAEARGVRANAFHPGLIRSSLMREAAAPIRLLTQLASRPPAAAAAALAQLAISPVYGAANGLFFKKTESIKPPHASSDRGAQFALWQHTAELVGLGDAGF